MKLATKTTSLWLAVLLVLIASVAADACPTCKDALADGHNSANLVRGYGWSIIFMMSTPFVLFTSLCGYFYYEVVKARRAAEAASSA